MDAPQRSNVRPAKPMGQQWTLIRAFGQRDLKSKFNGTALGWLWSLVVPLATLGIYTLVFGGLFKMPYPEIASRHAGIGILAVWMFAGLTIWSFFQNSINSAIMGILGTGGLLQKVYFPAAAPILGACLAVGVQSLIEVGILLAVLLILGNISWTWLLVPLFLLLLVIFVASLAVVVAIWNVFIRDLAHLVGVFLQLMFYATPIIYNPAIIPATKFGIPLHDLIMAMPMAQFVTLFRALTYDLTPGSASLWIGCLAWTALALIAAVVVHRRWGGDLGERI
ncbi:ABC transporter permease [Schaalia cardiffensis]|uniref:ABC transporter permease n=1 Tax=Schaalia cardiffensis TaxID=181487 RepID=UPI0023F46CB5|nr:ABC transporter permease [Schaalia cardiffensis]